MFCCKACTKKEGSPCLACARHGREGAPNMTDPSFKGGLACEQCVGEMKAEEKMLLEHRLGEHKGCGEEFPESELQYESPAYYDQRKAEWKHAHGDHSLCKKEYYLGCTEEEKAELKQFEAKSRPHDANAKAKTVTTKVVQPEPANPDA